MTKQHLWCAAFVLLGSLVGVALAARRLIPPTAQSSESIAEPTQVG